MEILDETIEVISENPSRSLTIVVSKVHINSANRADMIKRTKTDAEKICESFEVLPIETRLAIAEKIWSGVQ
jgi:hypothetical protein